ADRVDGEMAVHRVRDELDPNAVIPERMVQLVRLRHGDARVTHVGQDQRRRLHRRDVGDRGLVTGGVQGLAGPRTTETDDAVAPLHVVVGHVVLVYDVGDGGARDGCLPDT